MARSIRSSRIATGAAGLAVGAALVLGACSSGTPSTHATSVPVQTSAGASDTGAVNVATSAPAGGPTTVAPASGDPTASLEASLASVDSQLSRLSTQVGQSQSTSESDPSQP